MMIRKKIKLPSLILFLLTFWKLTCPWAKDIQIPGTIQPGQIEKQLKFPPQIPKTPQRLQPPAQKQTFDPADNLKFLVRKIELEKTTVYSQSELSSLFAEFLNKTATIAEIQNLAETLTNKYRNDGYILSQVVVPPQQIINGIVKLQAVEGYIDQVLYDGDKIGRNGLLAVYADKIKNSKPLNTKILERYLLLMNDLGGVSAEATLLPSNTETGASGLKINLSQKHVAASFGINNRGSRFLGPWRGELAADGFSLFGLNEHTGLRYITTGPSLELNLVALNHNQILNSEGLSLDFNFTAVESQPTLLDKSIDLDTHSRSGSIGLSYPLIRSREQNLNVRTNLTYFDARTIANGQLISKDHIRAIRFGAAYNNTDGWLGSNQVDFEIAQGIDMLNPIKSGSPNLSRAGGKSDFTKFNLYAARLQALAANWSLFGAFSGQYSLDALLAPEQFAFGGPQFGRGYDAAEIVGDSGVAFLAELRFTDSLPEAWLRNYEFYGFYDIGKVWSRKTVATLPNVSAMSVGLGVRLNFNRWISGYVEIDKPLTRNVAAKNNNDPRVFGGIQISF